MASQRRADEFTVITDAPENPEDQFRARRRKYLIMMGLRIACLVTAAIVVSSDVPWTPLWVGLCLVGMVALPWMAVLIANDRPPKKRAPKPAWWKPGRASLPPGEGRP